MPQQIAFHKTCILAMTVLLGVTMPWAAPANETRFNQFDTIKLLERDGAWKSRGYGILWHVRKRKVHEYEISGDYCIFIEAAEHLPDSADDKMLLDENRRIMRIGVADGVGYLHTFDYLKALPASCATKPDRSPIGVFNAVDKIYSHHYAFFSRRKLDWARIVAAYRPRISPGMSEARLFRVLSAMLNTIGDEHVWLRGEVDGEDERFSADGKRIRSSLPVRISGSLPAYWSSRAAIRLLGDNARRNSSGSIVYGLIDRDIGYLNLKSLWWRRVRDLNETLDRALRLFQSASIVIVDVSSNGGGSESLGKRVAERFTARRTVGVYKYAGDSKDDKPQPIFLKPAKGKRFLGPTFVISSRETFSAAETLVMFMSELPHVTHVGKPTAGALSDVLVRHLPNGWRVGLSNEVYLDTDGNSWEGIGVPAKVRLEVRNGSERASPGDLRAIKVVLDAIRTHARQAVVKND